MKLLSRNLILFFTFSLNFLWNLSWADKILGCGGFVKSEVPINFSQVEIKLFTKQGSLKYQTDCAPNNGYYLIPVYDKGEFVLKIESPPTWNFEPKQVILIIDGQNDVCSQGKDTNFYFKGFTISGKVVSNGHNTGPSGITVLLKRDKTIETAVTTENGIYTFLNVLPGSYYVIAQHPSIQFDLFEIKIEVDDKSHDIKQSLVISGYDVHGVVSSDGEAIKGVNFLLFSKTATTDIRNCIQKPVKGFEDNELGQPLCHVVSGDDGSFVFSILSPGEYTIVPFYKGENIHFDVTPSKFKFKLGHSKLILPEKFKLQGFNVIGHVLAAQNGPPVANAKVWLNDRLQTETKKDGSFTIVNMKTGTYKISIMKENIIFEATNVKITPSAPHLGPIIAKAFKVCGKLEITRLPIGLDVNSLRLLQIESIEDKKTPFTIRTNDKGEYCSELSCGKYKITPKIAEPEVNIGLKFIPEHQFITVKDNFIFDVDFKQFLAKISGEVKCKNSCTGAIVTLAPKIKGLVETNSFTLLNKNTFTFELILPGQYEIRIAKQEWCWSKNQLDVQVGTSDLKNLEFTQSGFVMNVVSSHSTVLNYNLKEEKGKFNAVKGSNSLCLDQSGIYELTTEGCHQFGNKKLTFNTNKPAVVVLQATQHTLTGNIKTNVKVDDLQLDINITSKSGKSINLTLNRFKEYNFNYHFNIWVEPEDVLSMKPRSGQILFTPEWLKVTAKDNCMENFVSFEGKKGFFIRGKVIPPLEDVEIYLGDGGEVLKEDPTTKTNKLGEYSIGPLVNKDNYVVQASKHGYILTRQKEFDFDAFKLAEIIVDVVDDKNEGINGVLLSLSGGIDYRQNSLTEKNGELRFINLEPGQYFLRPVLKEFNFTPPKAIVDLSEGKSVNLVLKATRVAYSCYGNITSLVGEPEPGIVVEAIGINLCKESQEEATTEAEGNYRIRGLNPGCQYQIKVKSKQDQQHSIEHATPIAKTIKVQNEDIKGLDIIVFRRATQMEISGNVITQTEFLNTLQIKLLRDESIVHTISMAQSTFFQLPSVPIDDRSYVVRLDTSLQRNSYVYNLPQVIIKANISYRHVTFKFEPKFKGSESDLHQGSNYAFPLAVIAVLIGLAYKQVIPLSNFGAEFVHNVRNPAVSSRDSFSVDSFEKKKKIKVKKI